MARSFGTSVINRTTGFGMDARRRHEESDDNMFMSALCVRGTEESTTLRDPLHKGYCGGVGLVILIDASLLTID